MNLSIAFHFEIDDQIENANDVMKQYFRIFCFYLQDDWVRWLSMANYTARNHHSRSIDCFSFFANHDYHSRMSIESFKRFENDLSNIDKERRLRLNANFNVEKLKQIFRKFQVQMIYA